MTIVNCAKGGVGKTFLNSLLLYKAKGADENFIMIDMDSSNRSIFKRFSDNEKYSDYVGQFSLLKDDIINNSLFSDFFLTVAESTKDIFYLDLGGNESRELISFIQERSAELVSEFFNENNIEIEFLTVVKLADRDCLDHLQNVIKTVGSHLKHTCMLNSTVKVDNTNIEYKVLEDMCNENKVGFKKFGLSSSNTIDVMSDYIRSGFTLNMGMNIGLFKKLINELEING